jgi:hypothetical protein
VRGCIRRINRAAVSATPSDGRIYFQPNLAVDDHGRLAISAFALENGRIDEVLLVSRPDQLHFGPPLRVTTASFNPQNPTTASRGKYGAWWIGDWQGLTSTRGAFSLVWNDTRTGKLDLFAATVRRGSWRWASVTTARPVSCRGAVSATAVPTAGVGRRTASWARRPPGCRLRAACAKWRPTGSA